MAERKGKKYPVATVRTWRRMTLSFGLVNIGVAIQPMISEGEKIGGHVYCAKHKVQINLKKYCAECDGPCEEVLHAYTTEDGRLVTMTDAEASDLIPLDYEKRLNLTAYVEAHEIDPALVSQSYVVWWAEDAYAPAFVMLVRALEESRKYLVGTTQLGRTSRVVILRWSDDAGTVVAHTLTHDAYVRWQHAHAVRDAIASIEVPEEHVEMALQVFETLADSFDLSTVEDTYNETLRTAIEAKARGTTPEPVSTQDSTPAVDLLAALKASVDAKPKTKRKVAA